MTGAQLAACRANAQLPTGLVPKKERASRSRREVPRIWRKVEENMAELTRLRAKPLSLKPKKPCSSNLLKAKAGTASQLAG